MRDKARREEPALRFEKYLLIGLGAALLFASTPACAGKKKVETLNYWFMGATEGHTLFHFIDASSVTYDGPTRSAWITTIVSGNGIEKYGMRRRMALKIFNCQRNSLFESRISTYDRYGENLLDHAYDDDDFRPIASGSVDATELEFVCSNPENWPSAKRWARIDVTPESMSDADNKAFQARPAP